MPQIANAFVKTIAFTLTAKRQVLTPGHEGTDVDTYVNRWRNGR